MGIIENAVARALEIAADDSHGYDQANRWGPDYDCSSLVISAFKKAGVPLSCTYTGNMRGDMLRHGFEDVTGSVDLATGAGLERGDVLLNHVHHTALYIGGGQLVQASINEYGGTTGGRTRPGARYTRAGTITTLGTACCATPGQNRTRCRPQRSRHAMSPSSCPCWRTDRRA